MKEKNLQLNKKLIGPLPIIDLICKKLGLEDLFKDMLKEKRVADKYASIAEIVIKSILIEPMALYRIPEWFEFSGIENDLGSKLTDDLIARVLDAIYSADRATFQTKLSMNAIDKFQINVDQIHNDSTTVKFHGEYTNQSKHAVKLKNGHSKDHRPDLKQLLFNLTVSSDGAIPIHYKLHDGNTTDDTTHIENWKDIKRLLMKSDFLYVADSKLCTSKNMKYIHQEGGKFVTVLPRTRKEAKEFYEECYNSQVTWDLVYRKKSRQTDSENFIYVANDFYQLEEGYRLYWYRSSEKRKIDQDSRNNRLQKAIDRIQALNGEKKKGPKTHKSFEESVSKIIKKYKVENLLDIQIVEKQTSSFKKTTKGRPTQDDLYRKVTKTKFEVRYQKNHNQIALEKAKDGLFPLVTNSNLDGKSTLEAYKYQPNIEKRFSLLKSDLFIAPVFIKKTRRIESLMFLHYCALIISTLVQRELKLSMQKKNTKTLPLLPEDRHTSTPTWEQINRLFANLFSYEISSGTECIKMFYDKMSDKQKTVFDYLGINYKNFEIGEGVDFFNF